MWGFVNYMASLYPSLQLYNYSLDEAYILFKWIEKLCSSKALFIKTHGSEIVFGCFISSIVFQIYCISESPVTL